MKKRLVIPALMLGAAAALTACSPVSSSETAEKSASTATPSATTVSPSASAIATPAPDTASASPTSTEETTPTAEQQSGFWSLKSGVDVTQESDIKNVATIIETYLVAAPMKPLDDFPEYAKKEQNAISKGNHVSLSYKKNDPMFHYLVRVWNPDSPEHNDPASAYVYDSVSGGLHDKPYATPKDLNTTIDITDTMVSK